MELTSEQMDTKGSRVGSASGYRVTADRIPVWEQTLQAYKKGKANLDNRIIAAEEFWKLRHWREESGERKTPCSGWLVNVILSKHSDAIDAYPETVCLAREEGDSGEADMLGKIIPVIKAQNEYEQVWSDVWWYKLKGGTGVTGYFWDPRKLNGLGDIAIEKVDILNLFWEPGCRDIQDSKYLFYVDLVDNDTLERQYPQLSGKLGGQSDGIVRKYRYDDSVDTKDKSSVVDVYYKLNGRLHMAKYCGTELLEATENDPALRDRGLYDHGLYPFVFDPLFPEEGYPDCGYGYVDLCKDAQNVIDAMNRAMTQASLAAATPRWFIRENGGVSPEEYADFSNPFVKVQGRLDEENLRQIPPPQIPAYPMAFLEHKIAEMKEVSGNRDVNNGGTGASVTAASAIAALQEAGNGLSRDMIASSYRATRKGDYMIIELIRQFYDQPRKFRILGEDGGMEYITYSNEGIKPVPQGMYGGVDLGFRLPMFDIEVVAQSESAYTKEAYNQLAVQLMQLGVFNPANAEQSLMMLDMMDFKGKDRLVKKLTGMASLYQQLRQYQQLALALAGKYEPSLAQGLMQQMTMGQAGAGSTAQVPDKDVAVGSGEKEHYRVRQAREQAEEGAVPR